MIDVKNEVDEFLMAVDEGELKQELQLAMDAYVDGVKAWNQMLRYEFMLPNTELGTALRTKYSIPVDTSLGERSAMMRRPIVLSSIWGVARSHISNSETLLSGKSLSSISLVSVDSNSDPSSANPAKSTITPTESIIGKWSLRMVAPNNQTTNSILEIVSVGTQLKATATGVNGSTAIENFRLEDGVFVGSFYEKYEGQPIAATITGSVIDGSMSGRIVVSNGKGNTATITFTGTKTK